MRKIFLVMATFLLAQGYSAFAANLSIEWQKNVTALDRANDYFTFKGALGSIVKDQFDPKKKVDAVTGASKLGSTAAFNAYRLDAKGKASMPSSLRGLFLFSVSPESTRAADVLSVSKASGGAITIRYIHRGSAYEIVTDEKGQLLLPTEEIKTRKIGHTDNGIGSDFSATGKADKADWTKIWDASIADGTEVKAADGKASSKTGKIAADLAASELFSWSGVIQFSFDGKLLKAVANLDAVKK
jgi:hypothetical protein